MRVSDMTIEIRSVALGRIGAIDLADIDYLQFVKRYRNVGSWSLVLPSEAGAAALLAQPGRGIIIRGRIEDSAPSLVGGIITAAPPNYGVLFSGPVLTWIEKESIEDYLGTFEFTGADDNIHLADARAYPDPANLASAQTAAYDVRSGLAETVARAYVASNIVSGSCMASRAVPGVYLAPTDQGRGATVSGRARFNTLGELLADVCATGGLGFDMVQNGSEIWFDVYEPEDKTKSVIMNIKNDQLESTAYGFSSPVATRVTVAGQGEGVDRVIIQRTTAESLAAEAAWGRKPEMFKDRRDAEATAELEADGDQVVAEGGKIITSLSVIPAPYESEYGGFESMDYGRKWRLGDLVSVVVDDQSLTAVVSEAIVVLTADGISSAATVGEPVGFDFESKIISNQSKQEKRLSSLERVAEGGGAALPPAGATGEVLTKQSAADGDADWGALPEGTHEATAATANTLAKRDASGRARFADPSDAQDAATKAYADARQTAAQAFATAMSIANSQLPTQLQETSIIITDANAATKNGWYRGSAVANGPPIASWFYYHVINYALTYVRQIAYYMYDDHVYSRRQVNGTWYGWERMYNTASEIVAALPKLPTAMAAGRVYVPAITASGAYDQTITYPSGRFTVAPMVTATTQNGWVVPEINSYTTGSFVLRMRNHYGGTSGATYCQWIAIQD